MMLWVLLLGRAAVPQGALAWSVGFAYVGYDLMHYSLHHTKLPSYLRDMKQYHLKHHYANYEAGFGVTSIIWDKVFGTLLN